MSARNFSKTFSGRTVLRGVALDVLPGEVHGLLGQNGSGKSTLIKILAGYHAPDSGAFLEVRGQPVPLPLNPSAPRGLGVAFVHQDLALAESLSVMENLRVGRYETGLGGRISWRRERMLVREELHRFRLSVSPDSPISALSQVERTMVAILRALDQIRTVPQGLLVLDEPTSALPREGVDALFRAVREIAARGFGILFVTHRLEEVRAITDRVSVLRDGALVETAATASLTERALIQRLLGRELDELYPTPHERTGAVALTVKGLTGVGVESFSLTAHQGEILGLTGLSGMGHEEIPYLLFGAARAQADEFSLDGRRHDLSRFSPKRAIEAGIVLVPGNRLRQGGLGTATVTENITLPAIRSFFSRGLIRRRRETERVYGLLGQFGVVPQEPPRLFATFSGGNQQKSILAKWFGLSPKLFLLHEPTHGVDVGARRQIFDQIQAAAEAGGVVIIASSEYEDLAHVCNRVIIFRNGREVSQLHGDALTHERIIEQCFMHERTDAPVT